MDLTTLLLRLRTRVWGPFLHHWCSETRILKTWPPAGREDLGSPEAVFSLSTLLQLFKVLLAQDLLIQCVSEQAPPSNGNVQRFGQGDLAEKRASWKHSKRNPTSRRGRKGKMGHLSPSVCRSLSQGPLRLMPHSLGLKRSLNCKNQNSSELSEQKADGQPSHAAFTFELNS